MKSGITIEDLKNNEKKYKINVTLYYRNNPNQKYPNQLCFSFLANLIFKNIKKLDFILNKQYIDVFTKGEQLRWFRFLKRIPEFRPFINPKEIVDTGIFSIDLDRIQAGQLFTLLTVIRAIQEQQLVVHNIIKQDLRKLKNLKPITILKLISSATPVYNREHWFYPVQDYDWELGLNQERWFKQEPISQVKPYFQISKTFQVSWNLSREFSKNLLAEYGVTIDE